MRIAFLGKGGSGKTTVTASFITYLSQENIPVVAVDADHNVHLQQTLGIDGTPIHLSDYFEEIKHYFKGNRDDLRNTTMIDSTPPSLKSNFIVPSQNDPFIEKYALKDNSISLLTVGTYKEEDAGKTCYHGKLGSLSLILNHLLDGKEDILVSDATAGIDNLGTTLYFAFDLTVFIVEPTKKSIDVFLTFEKVSKKFGIRTAVIINKVEAGDLKFVSQFLSKEKILGVIKKSSAIKRFEQGDSTGVLEFVNENKVLFKNIKDFLKSLDKNWDKYYSDLLEAHHALAGDWYDGYYGQEISSQKDPDFSYKKVIENS